MRARRIKGIEADYRKADREQGIALTFIKLWSHENMTWAYAKRISNDYRCNVSQCFPLAAFPRREGASIYEGEMGLWTALGDTEETGVITAEQAREIALPRLRGRAARAERWITHYQNRLDYERAMLDEGGGLIAEKHKIEIGGRVRIGAEWLTVLRLNKKDGKTVSLRTSRRYAPVVGIEEIQEYEAPSAEQAATAAEAMKLAPMCNYPGERFATCTEAEWKEIGSDYRGSVTIEATATHAAHRVRHAIGFRLHLPAPAGKELEPGYCNANRTHAYWPVFVTDIKLKEPPRKPRAVTAETLDAVTDAMFEHSEESGKIRAGIQWTTSTDGPGGECYQFDSLEELKECARAYQQQAAMMCYSLVTHSGQYKHMRTIYTWRQPEPEPATPEPEPTPAPAVCSPCETPAPKKLEFNQEVQFTRATDDDFRAMLEQLRQGVKVVVAPQLFPTPPALAARMVEEAGGIGETDLRILEPSAGTGALLNAIQAKTKSVGRGSSHVCAIEINRCLADGLLRHPINPTVICSDFMDAVGAAPDALFDAVLMNPPFHNGTDIQHIQHARKFLKPGGRLVALCANGSRQREILKPLASTWEDLPAGSFAEQGTNVNVALLVIEN